MTDEREDRRPGGSNAASGTKQIWVNQDLHQELVRKAEEDQRTIRTTVEILLREALAAARSSQPA